MPAVHDTHTSMINATLEPIPQNLAAVHKRMLAAAQQARRDPASIRLVAVSKTFTAAHIAAAYDAGQREFGENYLQEALIKIGQMAEMRELVWHFIGSVQSNKTRLIAEHFSWIHTVDRDRIARRLSEQRPATLPPLNVCIEVRLEDEPGKGGAPPGQVQELAAKISTLPHLRLRGLMCIPPPAKQQSAQRLVFAQLRNLFDELNQGGLGLDTLSMGMSADFEAAILEGATLIRLGSAIFGTRTPRHSSNQQ